MGTANILTILRIAAAPALVAAFLVEGAAGEALRLALFAAAAATDWLDGRIARSRNETSRIGAALDPAADKALVLCALVMLAGTGSLSAFGLAIAAVIVFREALVSGFREALGQSGSGLASARVAKWKTGFQLVALAVLIAGSLAEAIHPQLPALGEALLGFGALLGLHSGTVYAMEIRRRAKE